MTQILSVVNLKGGVGKTAIAVNIAAFCGRHGKRTLLVDVDPQTNATFSCIQVADWQEHAEQHGTIANLLGMRKHTSAEGAETVARDVIRCSVFPNVDLLPSHLDLFTIDLDLAGVTARETKLRRELAPVQKEYDMIVCDCPPNLTIPTQNALAMSTHYLVPVSPDYLSALGVGILLSRVRDFCDDLEHQLSHVGIVVSRKGRPAHHRTMIQEDLRDRFGDLVLTAEITERAAVSQAAEEQKPVYDMGNRAASSEFEAVAHEVLDKMGVLL